MCLEKCADVEAESRTNKEGEDEDKDCLGAIHSGKYTVLHTQYRPLSRTACFLGRSPGIEPGSQVPQT
jgi:hypothetical protein